MRGGDGSSEEEDGGSDCHVFPSIRAAESHRRLRSRWLKRHFLQPDFSKPAINLAFNKVILACD